MDSKIQQAQFEAAEEYLSVKFSTFTKIKRISVQTILLSLLFCFFVSVMYAQNNSSKFKVIAFYTAQNDLAHISFVHEANKWFPVMAAKYHFVYDSTNNWNNLNDSFLAQYQVVIFLDTRPDSPAQRICISKIYG